MKNLAIQLALLENSILSKFENHEIETISKYVSDSCQKDANLPLYIFSKKFSENVANFPNRFSENGEKYLLDTLGPLKFETLFDVGANVGTWSRHALSVFPEAELHAFEIVPGTFEKLRANIPREARVHLNQIGMSDEAGSVSMNLYESDLISSMFTLESSDERIVDRIDCAVTRGVDYASECGIGKIDFLKIDVEGAEGKVLDGFSDMFAKHAIRIVQFEYNRGAILGNFLLKNAYDFFGKYGYALGKLYPDGVRFHDYDYAFEDFIGPNYIACPKGDSELISLISSSSTN